MRFAVYEKLEDYAPRVVIEAPSLEAAAFWLRGLGYRYERIVREPEALRLRQAA